MARSKTKKHTHHKRGFSVSLAVLGGLAPGVMTVYDQRGAGVVSMANTLSRIYTGFSFSVSPGQSEAPGTWNPALMRKGLLPLGVGVLIHKAANRLGINRALRGAGISFVTI